jgi:phosphoribosylanthranilate isomerase
MNNRLIIKICGMKDAANRRELEKFPVDIFGFIFYPSSPRHVGDLCHRELYNLTRTQKRKAGVFVDSPVSDILETAQKYNLDLIQLHGFETPEFCGQIRSSGLGVIKVFRVDDLFEFSAVNAYIDVSDFFLFDTKSQQPGGSGRKFDWQILEKYRCGVPFFLSGGIMLQDVEPIIQFSHPALVGLDLNSGFEDEPGLKNPELIKSFFERLNRKLFFRP